MHIIQASLCGALSPKPDDTLCPDVQVTDALMSSERPLASRDARTGELSWIVMKLYVTGRDHAMLQAWREAHMLCTQRLGIVSMQTVDQPAV